MTPQQQVDAVLARTPPGECPPIPDFLLVRARRPLTKKQQGRLDEVMAAAGVGKVDRVDYRKPKGTSWEDWDAHLAREEATRRAKTLARVAELKETYGDRVKAPSGKTARSNWYAAGDVIKMLVMGNPCRPGSFAHAVFTKYRDGITVAEFDRAAKDVTSKTLKPADYLRDDIRMGRVVLERRE